MKKVFAALTALLAVIIFSSCGEQIIDQSGGTTENVTEPESETEASDIPEEKSERLILYRGDYYLCGEPADYAESINENGMIVGYVSGRVSADKSPENPLESNFLPEGAKVYAAPCEPFGDYKPVSAVYEENGRTLCVKLHERDPFTLPSQSADICELEYSFCTPSVMYGGRIYRGDLPGSELYFCKSYEDIDARLDIILENAEYIGETAGRISQYNPDVKNELESNCFAVGTKLYKSGEDIIAVFNELMIINGEYRIALRLCPYDESKIPAEENQKAPLPVLVAGGRVYSLYDYGRCMAEKDVAPVAAKILDESEYIGEVMYKENIPFKHKDMAANTLHEGMKLFKSGESVIVLFKEPYISQSNHYVYCYVFAEYTDETDGLFAE